jgi:large subunit ribosomal protein L19
MSKLLDKVNKEQIAKQSSGKPIPEFAAGDTLKVHVKVKEGTRERIQLYEGVCIARNGNGINASFVVRKISYGEGVERLFPLFSNRIDQIEVVRRGKVRRAKLFYLRDRAGRAARIFERTAGRGMVDGREADASDSQAVAAE